MATDALALQRIYEQQPLTFENEVSLYREDLRGWIVIAEPHTSEELEALEAIASTDDSR